MSDALSNVEMDYETAFMVDKVQVLNDGIIEGAIVDDGGEFWGLRVRVNDKLFSVWVNRDSEGNGPGWLDIIEVKEH